MGKIAVSLAVAMMVLMSTMVESEQPPPSSTENSEKSEQAFKIFNLIRMIMKLKKQKNDEKVSFILFITSKIISELNINL